LYKQAKEAQEKAAATNQGPLAVLRQAAAQATAQATAVVGANAGTTTTKAVSTDDDDESEGEEESESGSSEEEEYDANGVPTSTRSMPNLPTRKEMRSNLQKLATGTIDSVVPGFRGRYAVGVDENGQTPIKSNMPSSPTTAARESQTALILKSRAASHLQDILNSLEPFQYVLLLGSGRLQVNLKNPLLSKQQGTYVDFLVPGGAADKSGVVSVGDSIIKVGEQDVRRHTIADVPSIIAEAKRPVVLVLTTGVELDVERITYLDLAAAMMHQIRAQDEKQKQVMIASARKHKEPTDTSEEAKETEGEEKEAGSNTEDTPKEQSATEESKEEQSQEQPKEADTPDVEPSFDDIVIPVIRSIEDYASPPHPPLAACLAYQHLVGKRYDCSVSLLILSADHFAHFQSRYPPQLQRQL